METRQIKFRAWDKGTKKWLLGYELSNLGGFSLFGECMLFNEWSHILNDYILNWEDHNHNEDDLIVMQFTGLLDKNGKEIYEEDVLNKKTTFENNMADRRFQSATEIQVGFKDGCFIDINTGVTLFDKMKTISSYPLRVWTDYEIIGNRFENPELINN